MTPKEFMELVSELSEAQKLKVLRLLTIAASHPEARFVIDDCRNRGLDVDGTIAELSRRLWTN